jgi:hypothetical protein
MTRKETIKWLESLKSEIGKSEHRALWHYAEAIDMAIEALSTPQPLDVSQLNFGTSITMTESLADVSPMEWSKDVLSREKKVEVKADKDEDMVRVVRCKDCHYWYKKMNKCNRSPINFWKLESK